MSQFVLFVGSNFPVEQANHSCNVCSVLNRLNTCVLAGLPYLMKQKEERFAEIVYFL